MPSAARTANHTSVSGPKIAPMAAVPWRCTANSKIRITTVIGMTKSWRAGAASCRPSTALSTEIAGVIMAPP